MNESQHNNIEDLFPFGGDQLVSGVAHELKSHSSLPQPHQNLSFFVGTEFLSIGGGDSLLLLFLVGVKFFLAGLFGLFCDLFVFFFDGLKFLLFLFHLALLF